jgi:hypothetical protein
MSSPKQLRRLTLFALALYPFGNDLLYMAIRPLGEKGLGEVMSNQSSILGKAYEYAAIKALHDLVIGHRAVEMVDSESLRLAKSRFENEIDSLKQLEMSKSAKAGIEKILKLESKILEESSSPVRLHLQADLAGIAGDVRDILIERADINWETGISVKHNHEALKHSRLSKTIDFGYKWYDMPVSPGYWEKVNPIFEDLEDKKRSNLAWSALPDKEGSYYIPLLGAFLDEITLALSANSKKVVSGLITYLLGSDDRDYYKLIHSKSPRVAKVVPFNLLGTLQKGMKDESGTDLIEKLPLPTSIISLGIRPGSQTTADILLDNNWSMSFRIHNASTLVEPSLKFDVQLSGEPEQLKVFDCPW